MHPTFWKFLPNLLCPTQIGRQTAIIMKCVEANLEHGTRPRSSLVQWLAGHFCATRLSWRFDFRDFTSHIVFPHTFLHFLSSIIFVAQSYSVQHYSRFTFRFIAPIAVALCSNRTPDLAIRAKFKRQHAKTSSLGDPHTGWLAPSQHSHARHTASGKSRCRPWISLFASPDDRIRSSANPPSSYSDIRAPTSWAETRQQLLTYLRFCLVLDSCGFKKGAILLYRRRQLNPPPSLSATSLQSILTLREVLTPLMSVISPPRSSSVRLWA